MGTEVKQIPRSRRVIYDVYASFPTTDLQSGDLAYATNLERLYRWSGAIWQPITDKYVQGAKVYHSAAQSIPHNTWTTLTWDSEEWDTDTMHDPAANPSRLTCVTAGKYLICAIARFALQANATQRAVTVFINGIGLTRNIALYIDRAGVLPTIIGATGIVNLAVADYAEIQVFQNSTVAVNIETPSSFSMQRIG